jgi:hypothetical protein
MKKIVLAAAMILAVIGCSLDISNSDIAYCGKKQIADNVYIKKIKIDGDRIYFLVDKDDKLIGSSVSTSYDVHHGKTTSKESAAIISGF